MDHTPHPKKVIVLLQNHHPQDMKLITFALRANRVNFLLLQTVEQCTAYLVEQSAADPVPHFLLTDTGDLEFLKEISTRFPFCSNTVMIGSDLGIIFSEETLFKSVNGFVARNNPNHGTFPGDHGRRAAPAQRRHFGFRHFMHGCYSYTHQRIHNSSGAKAAMTQISGYVHEICQNAAVAIQVEGVCDELVMNALYDANPKYQDADRSTDIVLEDEEVIDINYGCDGKVFAISVTDPFGRLGRETIYQYLKKGFFEETVVNYDGSGAGLGFVRIFHSVNTLVINVVPGKKTEVIGILDISLNRRTFQRVNKSFYYFRHA